MPGRAACGKGMQSQADGRQIVSVHAAARLQPSNVPSPRRIKLICRAGKSFGSHLPRAATAWREAPARLYTSLLCRCHHSGRHCGRGAGSSRKRAERSLRESAGVAAGLPASCPAWWPTASPEACGEPPRWDSLETDCLPRWTAGRPTARKPGRRGRSRWDSLEADCPPNWAVWPAIEEPRACCEPPHPRVLPSGCSPDWTA